MINTDVLDVVSRTTEWASLAQDLCRVAHSDESHYSTAFLVCNSDSVFVAEPDAIGCGPIVVLAFVHWSPGDQDWLDVKLSDWWLTNLDAQYGGLGGALLCASREYVPIVDDYDRSYGPRAEFHRERDDYV